MNTSEIKTQNRFYWMDFTRIIACFAVIVIHTAGSSSLGNRIMNVLCYCAVPLFVMISGANFLDKDVDIKTIWKKYIIPMLISFAVWSFMYAIYTSYSYYAQFTDHVLGSEYRTEFIKTIIINTVNGHYHMWYIWMTIGLYAVMFFIRKLYSTCTKKQLLYFLIISFVYLCMRYAVQFPVLNNLNSMVTDIRLNFVMGFTIYFVGGGYSQASVKNQLDELVAGFRWYHRITEQYVLGYI